MRRVTSKENKDEIMRTFSNDEWIDVTKYDLKKLIKETYNLSRPQGLGIIHYEEGELSEEEINEILNRNEGDHIALSMDYIKGRACKMIVFNKEGKLQIRKTWLDHTLNQLEELIKRLEV